MRRTELKPIKLKLGEKVLLCPNINDKLQNMYKKKLLGTIVYINWKHRYFTAEFHFLYGSFRESYKFYKEGDFICLMKP